MSQKKVEQQRKGYVGGIALIVIGLIAFGAQFLNNEWLGLMILPILSLIFLAWGALTRESGFFIPGGILAGVGAGAILLTGPYSDAGDEMQGAIFMLVFALGWALIPLFSMIFTKQRHLWALIPGGIMALIGAGLFFGGAALEALELVGRLWPIVLILGGIYLLFRQGASKAS